MALTGVSKRDDCEQKWQSSGQPPGLGREDALDLDLGPAPGQPDLMGQRGQCHHRAVGQCGERGELVGGEEAALVEEGLFGGGDDGPVRRTQGDLGRGRWAGQGSASAGEADWPRMRKETGLVVVTAPTVVAGWASGSRWTGADRRRR